MDKEPGWTPSLPPHPPKVPPKSKQEKPDPPNCSVISRPGFGTAGRHISLLSNHFKVSIKHPDEIFYQYSVSIIYEDEKVVESKRLRRKVINKVHQTYNSELSGRSIAYDGDKCLYTVGPLLQNHWKFTLVLEESFAKRSGNISPGEDSYEPGKRSKCTFQSKTFKVEFNYAAQIPLKSIASALQESHTEVAQDAIRVLDSVLRQHAAQRDCLLVRQSFYNDDSRNFKAIGGGVSACFGLHSRFHPTHGGLSLNIDVSTTLILTPGPVIDFLFANQNVKEPRQVDWAKAKKMLKNLRVKTTHTNMEFKIIGLSEKPCNKQLFSLKLKNDDGEEQTLETTVCDYYTKRRNIELSYSAFAPCIDVGKPNRPIFLPLELCNLVSLQRYKKTLSSTQRASLLEQSRQKPLERKNMITHAIKNSQFYDDSLLASCGIIIERELSQVDGRVLEAPKLKVGNNEDCLPCNGRWHFNKQQFVNPVRIDRWAVVNFSAQCDTSNLARELINCGKTKGMHIERPFSLMEEVPQNRKFSPVIRVERMFELITAKLPNPPELLLCVLPKNSDLYGPWKRKSLSDYGIATQCICPSKITDRYLTNVLLKINTKLGGINSLLAIEQASRIPLIQDTPTMILGMDVSHGPPGRSDIPSIAAVVGSRSWPLISRYRAAARTQSSKVEMIESLFKPLGDEIDDGMMRELLLDFYETSNGKKPTQIIVFRDGVSETQFDQVLTKELDQIIKAYQHLGEGDIPKFTVIVAQKKHYTKLFQAGAPDNVPPGTVVDTKVVHPQNYDFYMCAHAGVFGTSRPTHYHVLLNEIGFSPDELQNLIHSLSYVYQRSTFASSIVAPIRYAHLAALQMGKFINYEELVEKVSGPESLTSARPPLVFELPRLHEDVESSMFFC